MPATVLLTMPSMGFGTQETFGPCYFSEGKKQTLLFAKGPNTMYLSLKVPEGSTSLEPQSPDPSSGGCRGGGGMAPVRLDPASRGTPVASLGATDICDHLDEGPGFEVSPDAHMGLMLS